MAFDLNGKAKRYLRIPTVDYSKSVSVTVSAQTGDVNARYFIVELFDDAGSIDLSCYSRVVLTTKFTDKDPECTFGEVNLEDSVVICKMPSIADEGKVACEISLIGEDSNGETIYLTSKSFGVEVVQSNYSDDVIESEDKYTVLVTLINELTPIEESENARIAAEEARVAAENERVSAESIRIANEEERVEKFTTLTESTQNLVDTINAAEEARVVAENARVAAETERSQAEEERVNAEIDRADNETVRQENETVRNTNETARQDAENSRVSDEEARAVAENTREENELVRQANEETRIAAEEERQVAEAKREAYVTDISEKFDGIETEIENATNSINDLSVKSEQQASDISDLQANKQDTIEFDGEYSSTNKAATVQTVIDKIAEIVANAPESLDTLKELADWITTHGAEAAQMNSDITALKESVSANTTSLETLEETVGDNADAVNDLQEDIATVKNEVLGVSGTLTIKASDWSNKTYTVTLGQLGTNDAVFFTPTTASDKDAIDTAGGAYTTTSGSEVTFTVATVPTADISLDYFIARGQA